ncbi:uncharacterized protein K452DRAFT_284121 [Aplosporella prunicola CBS 121167]|uniref:Uncharacterized protein n=1 Tax=Aplosporella prunicola CBS 121167 TaxID=1176127 RepID=A0A6A6BPT8_9PEZI|nr:uncharacterized protein K452DRAFT_284121 [Aplosporella prunicola CBS 121167]KAF2145748.1 hypothetical protein K452DRAFT_284121 [Aplosporella prunicola CBS 121167]
MVHFLRHPSYAHLSFEPLAPPESHILCPDYSADHRESKRRRIEDLGQRYLQGHPLHIHSAALKGPFKPGWRNPWKQANDADHKAREKRRRRQKHRAEKAAQLQKDGLGKTPARPVDLTDDAQPSDYSHEWLRRRPFAKKPSVAASDDPSGFQEPLSHLEHITPSKPSQPRPAGKVKDVLDKINHVPQTRSSVPEPPPTTAVHARNAGRVPALDHNADIPSEEGTCKETRPHSPLGRSVNGSTALSASLSSVERDQLATDQGYTPKANVAQKPLVEDNPPEESATTSMQIDTNGGAAQRLPLQSIDQCGDDARMSHTPVPLQSNVEHDSIVDDADSVNLMVPKFPKNSSGFTAINQRPLPLTAYPRREFSGSPVPRTVLADKSDNNNNNNRNVLADPSNSLKDGDLVATAMLGDKPYSVDVSTALSHNLDGQENAVANSNCRGGTPNVKERQMPLNQTQLQQSTEKHVAKSPAVEESARKHLNKKMAQKKRQYLNASPMNTSSPGFSYRKISDPTKNQPQLGPTDDNKTETTTTKKQVPRRIDFESSMDCGPAPPILERSAEKETATLDTPETENLAGTTPQRPEAEHEHTIVGDCSGAFRISSTRELSTQAALLLAQEAFQKELVSPLKETSIVISPLQPKMGKGIEGQDEWTTTPPSSQPEQFTTITPFREFNHRKSPSAYGPPGNVPVSTQDLFNAASPFMFSTVKKKGKVRKSVSIADILLPEPKDDDIGKTTTPAGNPKDNHGIGRAGQVTEADGSMTMMPPDWSATSLATPFPSKHTQSQTPHSLPSAMKSSASKSLPPTSSAIAPDTTTTTAMDSNATPLAAAYEHNSYTLAPESEPPGSEKRRAGSVFGGSTALFEPAQRRPSLDDVDVDEALEDAGSFLQGWDVGAELRKAARSSKGTPVR